MSAMPQTIFLITAMNLLTFISGAATWHEPVSEDEDEDIGVFNIEYALLELLD